MHQSITTKILFLFIIFSGACKNKEVQTLNDIDGNNYRTVRIGNQVWMAENLKVTRYRNGDVIPNISVPGDWEYTQTGALCDYKNDTSNVRAYGKLYNWFAVNDSRNIAPEGWHIPTEAELDTLINFLRGDTTAAGKLKEKGNSHWLIGNAESDNVTGFSARPGGYRFADGTFHTKGSNGYWWLHHSSYEMYGFTPRLYKLFADISRDEHFKNYGFSVRCIKD
jgi:uncharacterized protein (TIGR02145 family)